MRVLLAIIIALNCVVPVFATTNNYEQPTAYEIFVQVGIVQDNHSELNNNITNSEFLSFLINVFEFSRGNMNSINSNESDENILNRAKELGFVLQDENIISTNYLSRENMANVLANVLRKDDNFKGMHPSAKFNVSDYDQIDAGKVYDLVSMYSMGIVSLEDGKINPTSFVTKKEVYNSTAKVFGFTQVENIEINGNYLPVIMYHSVLDDPNLLNEFIISTKQFTSDLEYIKTRGYTPIYMQDLIDFVYNDGTLPEKPIMITFDDGYEDNYTNAYQVLKEYNMKAIVCPITKFYMPGSTFNFPHLTLEQTKEMQDSGLIEIQNHTYDLHDSSIRMGVLRLENETYEQYKSIISGDILKTNNYYTAVGINQPTTFSYPYGADSQETEDILKELGFLATLDTTDAVLNKIEKGNYDCLFNIKRLNRPNGISSEEFFKSIELLN